MPPFTSNYCQQLKQLDEYSFQSLALEVFKFQAVSCDVYKDYLQHIRRDPNEVQELRQIPFLPISFFKQAKIVSCSKLPKLIFESSGTTDAVPSKHYILDENIYHTTLVDGFVNQYGSLKDFSIFALLPSYLERKHSSLVYMVQQWMNLSDSKESGFFLYNFQQLNERLKVALAGKRKVLLIGVSFALLDFAERFPMDLSKAIVMETGGMKGRRQEITRAELHQTLQASWNLETVHAEYGMTELLSQAYAKQDGLFFSSRSLKAFVRPQDDPLTTQNFGNGALNFIDLANLYSCSFLATEDVGTVHTDGSFEVLGRQDHAALRGCSQLFIG